MALHGHGKLPPTRSAADRWLQALLDDGHTSMAWSSDTGALIGLGSARG
jgi:hypothetical protein